VQTSENALLFKIQSFSYVYSTANQEIRYVSQQGQSFLQRVSSAKNLIQDLFPCRQEAKEIELASKEYVADLRVCSSELIHSEDNTIQVLLYEKTISLDIDTEEEKIEGIQGLCVVQDEDVTLEDQMSYVRVMLKCELSYYLSSPQTDTRNSHYVKAIANRVATLFEETLQFRKKDDRWSSEGRNNFCEGISFFISRSLPILFGLPAFPFKSPNSDFKVLGELPDKGEELSLRALLAFCLSVESIYAPGARINIVSDGTVFADLFGVSEETATEYKEHLKLLVPEIEKYITFRDLSTFFDDCNDLPTKRQELLKFSGHSAQYIKNKIHTSHESKKMYCGFIRITSQELYSFMALDSAAAKDLKKPAELTYSKIKKLSTDVARVAMIRNEAYSRLVQELLPLYVRFSIHLYDNSGPKYSVKLLDLVTKDNEIGVEDNHIPTPWHNVIVETKEGKYVAMRKHVAEREFGEGSLVYYKPGWPSHYKQQ